MADKLIYIPNDDTQNYPFCTLKLAVDKFGHSTKQTNKSYSIKVPNVVKLKNEKTLL